MRPTAPSSLILLLSLAAVPVRAQTPAEPPTDSRPPSVGLAGDPEQIVILGAEAFDPVQITSALAGDLVYQAAARPSGELETLLHVCRQRIHDGYLRAGRLEAAVTVHHDAREGRLVAKIDEGPAFVAGDIRITGAKKISADEFASRLQQSTEARPWVYLYRNNAALNSLDDEPEPGVWRQGEPAACDAQSIDALARRVELHLADMGRPFAEFRVRPDFGRRPGTVDLLIEIDDEGPSGILDNIEIKGLTRHSREQVLAYLDLHPGKPIDAAECERICKSLGDCCRFWKYAVFVRSSTDPSEPADAPAKPPRIELGLSVLEYDRVPMLGEPLSEADQCLVRAARWLERFADSGGEEELTFRGLVKAVSGDAEFANVSRAVFSPRHGCLVDARGEHKGIRFDAALHYTPDQLALYDWRSGNKFTAKGVVPPQVNLKIAGVEFIDGKYRSQITFGAGVRAADHSEAGVRMNWAVAVQPASLVHEAHRSGAETSFEEGVLIARSEFSEIHVEAATGRIIQWRYLDEHGDFVIAFRRGEFQRMQQDVESRGDDLQEMFDVDAPFASGAAFAITSALTQPYVRNCPLAEAVCRRALAALEQGKDDAIIAAVASHFPGSTGKMSEDGPKFIIPTCDLKTTTLGHFAEMVHSGPAVADVMFPRGTWPWTLAREVSFLAADGFKAGELSSRAAAPRELRRIIDDPNTGPVGKWAIVQSFRWFGASERALSILADRLLRRWHEAGIGNEVTLLFHGEHGLARIARAAARVYDELPDADRRILLESLPDACRPALERFFAKRDGGATETPEQSLEAALVETWNAGLNESLRADLRRVATPSEPPAAKVAAPERSPKR